ncbi:hypothetical protein [Mycoplasma sp. HU2014]|uniref:hypothetical protein n=1 Tax=Mycoplasma sp. HU2014 TaxID=1664275 RepID=UPI00067C13DD|nr:hypothetical protein [Mycoplasma sp. HU2014]KNG79655.1 hypothetical protein AB668_00820 [Mycoplasma sp. HU2014]
MMFKNKKSTYEDESEVLVSIINSKINENVKLLYISNTNAIIRELPTIENIKGNKNVLDRLFIEDRIEFNQQNIQTYLELVNTKDITWGFVDFLNRNVNNKNFINIFSNINSNLIINLIKDIDLSKEVKEILQEIQ